jgi:hypothetical protein
MNSIGANSLFVPLARPEAVLFETLRDLVLQSPDIIPQPPILFTDHVRKQLRGEILHFLIHGAIAQLGDNRRLNQVGGTRVGGTSDFTASIRA